jgi:hypothetical protein
MMLKFIFSRRIFSEFHEEITGFGIYLFDKCMRLKTV